MISRMRRANLRESLLSVLRSRILTSMLRSRSWEISIPLARKTSDMQDLYPCKEDIASFFSSTGRWGNQLLLDSCLDRINCLTWHHSPNTFHLRFVNPRWGLSLRYSEPLGNRFRKSSLLVESLDNLYSVKVEIPRMRMKVVWEGLLEQFLHWWESYWKVYREI